MSLSNSEERKQAYCQNLNYFSQFDVIIRLSIVMFWFSDLSLVVNRQNLPCIYFGFNIVNSYS
jgi:hypothetical protein